jgi:predicted dehydrogenase
MNYRVGFIGTGEITYLHSEAMIAIGWKIIGCYDIDVTASKRFSDRNNCTVFRSSDELLQSKHIDIVFICTRHDSHVTLLISAIQANKHVFVEKPLAMSIADTKGLDSIMMFSRKKIAVGYNMRVTPATLMFQELIEKNKVRPISFRASMTGPSFMKGWPSDPLAGGGSLVCQGSHIFDLLQYILNSNIKEVTVKSQHVEIDNDSEPNLVSLLIRLENNVLGTVLLHDHGCSGFHAGNEGRMVNLALYSKEGTYEFDVYGRIRWGNERDFSELTPYCQNTRIEQWGYQNQILEFQKLINNEKSHLCSISDALSVVRVVDAAKLSADLNSYATIT